MKVGVGVGVFVSVGVGVKVAVSVGVGVTVGLAVGSGVGRVMFNGMADRRPSPSITR